VEPGRAAHGAAEAAEESEWIGRAQGGDTEAFRRLVERHQDRAYGLALRILGSASDAEEAAQDAFVRVWRALPEFRGEARFGTWLHRIVVRCAYDAASRRRRRGEREESLDAILERRGVEPSDPAGTVPGAGEGPARRLERMMRTLSDVQRAVVTLYYYEDRSVEEAARVLELPANTVKTHLHRARAALRAALQREEAAEW
jgi:RNA polymerase sigma-70 factor (ECF subfamily)